jgi:hypothetical protein
MSSIVEHAPRKSPVCKNRDMGLKFESLTPPELDLL